MIKTMIMEMSIEVFLLERRKKMRARIMDAIV
jgi:hypothetical protein